MDAARDNIAEFKRPLRAAVSTYEALVYELRTYGIAQLASPRCRGRLADLSAEQTRDLIAALIRLKPIYLAITDELLLKLGTLL
jgi:hypothetical protein